MVGFIKNLCDYCGVCVAVCPEDAITLREISLDIGESCIDCMLCIYICPFEALTENEKKV